MGSTSTQPRKASARRAAGVVHQQAPAATAAAAAAPQVRAVRQGDLPEVIALDATVTGLQRDVAFLQARTREWVISEVATVTGLHKADYWQRIYRRYGVGGQGLRHFLVAVQAGRVVGFMIGEVRDWEFGSPPCGWVFAIDVDPRARQQGVGTMLLTAMRERFERVGVRVMRTLLASDNPLILSFFRSQGMTAGRLIPLELAIGAEA